MSWNRSERHSIHVGHAEPSRGVRTAIVAGHLNAMTDEGMAEPYGHAHTYATIAPRSSLNAGPITGAGENDLHCLAEISGD